MYNYKCYKKLLIYIYTFLNYINSSHPDTMRLLHQVINHLKAIELQRLLKKSGW